MFNKNFDAMRQLSLYGANAMLGTEGTDTNGNHYTSLYANSSPNACALGLLNTTNDFNNFAWAQVGVCLWIGNGTVAPTADDITMAVDPTQPVSATNLSTSFVTGTDVTKGDFVVTPVVEQGIVKVRYDRTFTALRTITVNEIVLSRGLQTGTTSGSAQQFMFERTVLTDPKTYEAGQSFTVTIMISPYAAS